MSTPAASALLDQQTRRHVNSAPPMTLDELRPLTPPHRTVGDAGRLMPRLRLGTLISTMLLSVNDGLPGSLLLPRLSQRMGITWQL